MARSDLESRTTAQFWAVVGLSAVSVVGSIAAGLAGAILLGGPF